MKRRKRLSNHTWPGVLFGVALLALLAGAAGLIFGIVLGYLLPDLNVEIAVGVGVGAMVSLVLTRDAYLSWADRVAGKWLGTSESDPGQR